MTRAEQETVIRWNAADPTVELWTCEPKTLRKLKRLGYAPVKAQGPGGWFTLEKGAVGFRRPRKRVGAPPRHPLFTRKTLV